MNRIALFFALLFIVTISSAQCTQGDCTNGQGTFIYPSGAKYIGSFQDGEIHGVGVCYYTDGSKYSGQWNHRYPEGKGTKTYTDGSQRAGLWLQGQPADEYGKILELASKGDDVTDNTDIQSGCVKGDCEAGQGVYVYIDGSKYDGQFLSGKLDGWGTWYYPDGDKYIGMFKNNYSHGKGTVFHKDGNKTTGEWVEGEYISDGRADLGREGCIIGNCQNGKGTYIYEDGVAKYVGDFRGGMAEGRGICYYANGEKYEGSWSQGTFNGQGILFMLDGTKVNGLWNDGTYMGKENTATPVAAAKPVATAEEVVEFTKMKVWAVVIGVSNYGHMPALKYTDDDAYRIYAHLKSPGGGALSDDQIKILIDEDATRGKIKSTMENLFSQAGPNDLIMLYFSGHGLKGSFLPIDFDGFNNKLLHEEINTIFDESPAKYKLCIADACHSGSLFTMRSTVSATLDKYYQTLAQANPGTALIMSSKSDETSLESSGLRQGVFSHFLIRGLKGEADQSQNGVVSVEELYEYINNNVRSYTGMRQSPVIKGDYDKNMTVSVVRE